ncbi:MAG: zinc-ribbon domain containing protein [Chloroflexota bacterium]|nr:zinc-ribbon domain containing protein [Chloroflexota bacterium]
MSYIDKTLECTDCGESFTFGVSEQELFASKGYTNEPKRCPECRMSRKQQRPGSSFSQQRELFPAICATCGKSTQVPFQPRQDRPVYCSDCYNKVRPRTTQRY